MTFLRARWLAARTRNAARHGLFIAGVGTLVMIAALLTFVLLPRQADRALARAVAALPPAIDTLTLLASRARIDSVREIAAAQRAAAKLAEDSLRVALGDSTETAAPAVLRTVLARDTALRALAELLLRARQAPLLERYRALAEAPAMARDVRAYERAMQLRDSIEALHLAREAATAQGGPDARYTELTARIAALGDRLVQLATGVLRAQRDRALVAADSGRGGPDSLVRDGALRDGGASAGATRGPAVPVVPRPVVASDSALARPVREATDSTMGLDSLLARARRFNDERERRRTALRARRTLPVPPVAMLLAALVLGVTVGFAASLWRELRRPRVGDAQELEELTQAQVIVHDGDATRTAARARRPRLGSRVVARFGRRQRDQVTASVLTPTADAWSLLHLTLSHIGDMARQVQVIADRPVVAGAVGLNLAAVAARESRVTVLVDAAQRAGALVPLLPSATLAHSVLPPEVLSVAGTGTAWDGAWDASRALPLGRDVRVTIVLPRRARTDARADAPPRGAPSGQTRGARAPADELAPLLPHFDFVVFVSDAPNGSLVPATADLVLCARLGVTPLAWIARAMRAAADQGRRVRAVVLWADEAPLAGSRASG